MSKKVSKLEEKQSILKTLEYNQDAMDYIQNKIYKLDNQYRAFPEDKEILTELNINKYILFSLDYLDKCYNDRLKCLGVFKV